MRKPTESDGRPELVVLRAIKVGDLLLAVPALHAIRRANPEHRLILATTGWLEPLAELIDGLDAFLPQHGLDHPIALERGRVDTVVNLHGRGPQSTDLLDALDPRRRVGHRFGERWDGPEWRDGGLERVRWAELVQWHGMPADPDELWLKDPGPSANPDAVVVHIGAAYGSRLWPAERFGLVARILEREGGRVLISGGASERDRAAHVAELAGLPEDRIIAGRADLREFAATVASARLVVTVDTGAAHLASAYRTPSVIVFGPAPVEEWGPPAGPHIALTDASLRRGDGFADDPDPALLAVTADDVLAAARGLLG
ncbi:glycosyltransferase family 9 protein [Herbiconiux sp. L3-i23]|uniref:glycosyltransferase family 9 protein n=1 Tax=Herbiconiux sp. L3-i23 TaxID=2905871 RepID=UPI0020674727|nr:glycosyltransferase family 9 protein [Herbiconiux sp. L3-i23]BDI23322.1 glycosyl transferase [Herbiconiux sp. L3-i23]